MDDVEVETTANVTDQPKDSLVEGPALRDGAINYSPVEPAAEHEALTHVAGKDIPLPVDLVVEHPRDVRAGKTVTKPAAMPTDDLIFDPSRPPGYSGEEVVGATGEDKSVSVALSEALKTQGSEGKKSR